jgi:large subunit ribosomal protein L9
MKVILMRDVAKLGLRYTIAEVPDGYALNKLIPAGTPENLKKVHARSDKQASTQLSQLEEFKQAVAALKVSPAVIAIDANAQDHLFKSVKASDIAAACAALGHAIPVDAIKLAEPIKALGEYAVPVVIGPVHDSITIKINRA